MDITQKNEFQLLIRYVDYCKATNQTPETNKPDWFDMDQQLALSIIYKNMTQTHLFPMDRAMFRHMKDQYKLMFIKALAWQIKYVNDNQELYDNPTGYLSSRQVGTFNRGALSTIDIDKLLNVLSPKATFYLEQMGWLYKSLTDQYELSQFYDATIDDDYATESYVLEKMEDAMAYADLADQGVKTYIEEYWLQNQDGYGVNKYLKVVEENNELKFKWVDLGGIVQDNLLQWDNETKEIFKGTEGAYTIVDDILLGDKTVLTRIQEEIDRATTAENTKVSKITTTGYGAYGHNGSTETEWVVDANATAQTLAYRTSDGRLRVGTPTENTDAATKDYVDKHIVYTAGNGLQLNEKEFSIDEQIVPTKDYVYSKEEVDTKIGTMSGTYLGTSQGSATDVASDEAASKFIGDYLGVSTQVNKNDYFNITIATNDVWNEDIYRYIATGNKITIEGTEYYEYKFGFKFAGDLSLLKQQVETNTGNIETIQNELSTNVPKLNADNTFTGNNTFSSGTLKIGTWSVSSSDRDCALISKLGAEFYLKTGLKTKYKASSIIIEDTSSHEWEINLPWKTQTGSCTLATTDDIETEATRVNNKYTMSTTAPTEAITDGGIHIVVLDEEPETKYDGYIYMIKEA